MRAGLRDVMKLPPGIPGAASLHLRAAVRERFGIPGDVVRLSGEFVQADLHALQQLAEASSVGSGMLFAAGAMHEATHVLFDRSGIDFAALAEQASRPLGRDALADLATEFRRHFPPGSADALEAGGDGDGRLLQELLLLRLQARNRALAPLSHLWDDADLRADAPVDTVLDNALAGSDTLRELTAHLEQIQSRSDLAGQLAEMAEAFRYVGPGFSGALRNLSLAVSLLHEDSPPLPPGPGPAPAPGGIIPAAEPHFAEDEPWMRDTVMTARSTLVWLDQLSRQYDRPVRTLADVPEEELAWLAGHGVNALWLVGIWERSGASRTIKRLAGQPEAEASAYALDDYVISRALGGEEALDRLAVRAGEHGIRLACDMVPNHMGIDSRWVVEHPDWFLQLEQPPFASYSFTGPDVSSDPRVKIQLEDGYIDGSDAAVVFRWEDAATGRVRYIHHGNDGTGLPWNDTAQIDFLNPEARQAVIDTLVRVARSFPVIRIDAAMTLVSRHIRRLWYPAPGSSGAIASRAWHGTMEDEEFQKRLPAEFWLEAVGQLRKEVPGTLLLAEAFWMMEGYFVSSLGFNRVYNSAFMHHLQEGDLRGLDSFLRSTRDSDPRLPGRLVNYLSTPDEESARTAFGAGDHYFRSAALLATVPGLPLLGHGELQGLAEKYGMEFSTARTSEQPDAEFMTRYGEEIAPLLQARPFFSGTEDFRLLDAGEGNLAFSNRTPAGRHLCVIARGDSGPGNISLPAPAAGALRFRSHPDGLERVAAAGIQLKLPAGGWLVLHDFRDTDDVIAERLGRHLRGSGTPDLERFRHNLELGKSRRQLRELLQAPDHSVAGVALTARLDVLHDLWKQDPGFMSRVWAGAPAELRLIARAGQSGPLERAVRRLLPDSELIGLVPRLLSGAAWWHHPSARGPLGVNEHGGETWFRQENWESLAAGSALLMAVARSDCSAGRQRLAELLELGSLSGFRLRNLPA